MTIEEKIAFEKEISGGKLVAGVDEVGRGPLAGPVVCACCIMDYNNLVEGVDDSKKLSAKKRQALGVILFVSFTIFLPIIP